MRLSVSHRLFVVFVISGSPVHQSACGATAGAKRRLGLLGGEQLGTRRKPHAGFSFTFLLLVEVSWFFSPCLWGSHKPHRSSYHVENNRGLGAFGNRGDVENVAWKHVCRANSACGEHSADVLFTAAPSASHVASYCDGSVQYVASFIYAARKGEKGLLRQMKTLIFPVAQRVC